MIKVVITVLILATVLAFPLSIAASEEMKVIVSDFNIKDGKITYLGSTVEYGYPPDYLAHEDFKVKLFSVTDELTKQFGIEDPRILYHDKGATIVDDVNFSIIVPFKTELKRMEVFNGTTGELATSVNISEIVSNFCQNNPKDPDCIRTNEGRAEIKGPKTPEFDAFLAILALLAVSGIVKWLKGRK